MGDGRDPDGLPGPRAAAPRGPRLHVLQDLRQRQILSAQHVAFSELGCAVEALLVLSQVVPNGLGVVGALVQVRAPDQILQVLDAVDKPQSVVRRLVAVPARLLAQLAEPLSDLWNVDRECRVEQTRGVQRRVASMAYP